MLNWLILIWLIIITTAINIYDLKNRLILNWSILLILVLGSVSLLNNWNNGGIFGLISFGVFAVLMIVTVILSGSGSIGGGDIKYILASALFLNYLNIEAYAFSFFIVGLGFFIFHKLKSHKTVKRDKEFYNLEVKEKKKISVAGAPSISLPLIFAMSFTIFPNYSNIYLYIIFLAYIFLNVMLVIILKKYKVFHFYDEVQNDNQN